MSTPADLDETARQVEALGRRIVARQADVRDEAAVRKVFEDGIAELGRVDVVIANAGIMTHTDDRIADTPVAWHAAVDTMLTGVVHTVEAALPTMIEQGAGGSIVIINSIAGLKGSIPDLDTKSRGLLGYVAAKHGSVGLMRAYANALGGVGIRVNTIHPTGVNTPMIANDVFARYAQDHPTIVAAMQNALPVPMIESIDVTNAVMWLCTDAGRYVTGVVRPIDAGATVR